MELIKNWAYGICIVSLACAGLTILMPSGNMKKIIRLVLSLCFLYALFSPLVQLVARGADQLDFSFPQTEEAVEQGETYAWEQSMQVFAEKLETQVEEYLVRNFDVGPVSAQIQAVYDADAGQIGITEASVTDSDMVLGMDIALRNALYDEFGLTFEVIPGEGGE